MPPTLRRFNLPFLLLAVLALLAALWAGLLRLGWALPVWPHNLAMAHGPLMIGGFLGTLISLERAVGLSGLATGRRWTYAAPALAGLGALLTLLGVSGAVGPLLITLGSAVLLAAMLMILRIQVTWHGAVMALGGVAWLAGNALWLAGRSVAQVELWWAGFLLLTIVGERLELNRLLRPTRAARLAFAAATALFLAGLAASLVSPLAGTRLAGLGMLALAAWLLNFDIARRTVRKPGLTRFIAVCLLSGFGWLAVAGVLSLLFGGDTAGLHYDARLHSLFVGFVVSMIFGHAPIILPAVLGLPLRFGGRFYAPLILLQASLALRVAGDLAGWFEARRWGGLLNEVALLLFLLWIAQAVRRSRREG